MGGISNDTEKRLWICYNPCPTFVGNQPFAGAFHLVVYQRRWIWHGDGCAFPDVLHSSSQHYFAGDRGYYAYRGKAQQARCTTDCRSYGDLYFAGGSILDLRFL